ncbi:methyltransferase, putative [Acanthamoeba castellanii str. Neff]|uniref:Methyltransferase, putative n=1 Tax=Acanthamoeba castellanii (strain ATCC 30010 / Neff) TaxID=1257118 RepID=L8GZ44_ACACF|nr:methyltransferase, putative [Acanthamoeba castellanii str. Neff]ELR17381.1 methyltransferase, putative [Acanthamoeba castellanii str. Neff]
MTKALMQQAAQMCKREHEEEIEELGLLPPSHNIDPLNPPLTIAEYEAMEKDLSKYLLYMAALSAAVGSLPKSLGLSSPLKFLVVGPGLGRLITFCLDAATSHGRSGVVHVLEANPRAVGFLEERFAAEVAAGQVVLHEAFILRNTTEPQDLPKSLAGHVHSFNIIAITIPDRWKTYLAPIYCPSIYAHIASKGDSNDTQNQRHSSMAHVTAIPADAVLLGPSRLLYSASCVEPPTSVYAGEIRWKVDVESTTGPARDRSSDVVVHGFVGHFTCHLFGGIKLDTRHGSAARNTFHWESMFFPLSTPVDLGSNRRGGSCRTTIGVRLERRSAVKQSALASGPADLHAIWYEWRLLSDDDDDRPAIAGNSLPHNPDGRFQSLYL